MCKDRNEQTEGARPEVRRTGNGATGFRERVRLASVPFYMRMLFASIPADFTVEIPQAFLEDAQGVSLPMLQLSKLVLLRQDVLDFGDLKAVEGKAGAGVLEQVVVHRGGKSFVPTRLDVERGVSGVVRHFLEVMLSPTEFSGITERFALQSSTLATLKTLTAYMLQSDDVDRALYIMLSGITAGYALGFNRAALFTYDEATGTFQGAKAIGPDDEDEAHRVWEAMELADTRLEDLIRDIQVRRFDTAFQRRIQGMSFSSENAPGLVQVVTEATSPVVLTREQMAAAAGRQVVMGDQMVLAPLRPHGRLLALVMADNLVSRAPFGPDQLSYFSIFVDQTALAWENLALLKRVEAMARVDALTGVLSRRELQARTAAEFARCRRYGRPCALAIVDVDHFKEVNDTQGHSKGDELLRNLGRLLANEFRVEDVVGRFGGDEFVVVMPEVDRDGAARAMRRVGEMAGRAGLSLSVGIAAIPGDADSPESLFCAADSHLYQVKRNGRCGFSTDGVAVERFAPPSVVSMP